MFLLTQVDILPLHWYHAETTIYETAMAKSAATDEIDFTRLDHLYACLNAVQKRFDVLLSFPASEFAYIPSTILFPTAHSLISLLRLSTFEYPGWDPVMVRRTADLLSLTQQVADKFLRAAEAVGIQNPPNSEIADCFTTASRILLGLRAGWASRLPELPNIETTGPPAEKVPPLPDINQELIDTWLSSQDLTLLSEPSFGGAWWY